MPQSSAFAPETTVDAFLGGRVEAVQPAKGYHRAGLEAVLLGASLDPGFQGKVIDLGAGTGVAGFSAAARCPGATAVLVERDPVAAACAREALRREANHPFSGRVAIVETDIARRDGLEAGKAGAVLSNPPFRDPAAGSRSPAARRAEAHVLAEGGVDPWFRAAASLLRPGGNITMIYRADGIAELLEAAKGRFGALDLLPVLPREGEVAHRVLLRGIKGSRAPLRLLPPLVLHGPSGNRFRAPVEAILRDGAALADAIPAWQTSRTRPS